MISSVKLHATIDAMPGFVWTGSRMKCRMNESVELW